MNLKKIEDEYEKTEDDINEVVDDEVNEDNCVY